MEVIVARGPRRLIGLIGRRSLPAGVALEMPRCRSVHTFGMRFALDLVWLDGRAPGGAGRPRGAAVARAPCRQARSVLELDSRFSNQWSAYGSSL